MAIPSRSTSLKDMFEFLLFTSASLMGTVGLESLGKRIFDSRGRLQSSVQGRNEAEDKVVVASVAQSLAWARIPDPLQGFMIQAKAYLAARPGTFEEVFAGTLATLLRTPERKRLTAFAPIVALARTPGLRGRMETAAKAFLSVWDAFEARTAEVGAATRARDEAAALVATVREECIIAMREVNAVLRQRFAANPIEVRRFFVSRPPAKKKAGEKKKENTTEEQKAAEAPAATKTTEARSDETVAA